MTGFPEERIAFSARKCVAPYNSTRLTGTQLSTVGHTAVSPIVIFFNGKPYLGSVKFSAPLRHAHNPLQEFMGTT
jgi:hypothetical protein